MIRYARLRPGHDFKLGRALAYYAQRFVTARTARQNVSRCLSALVRLKHGRSFAEPPKPETMSINAVLERDGLARLDNLFPPDQLEDVVAYFRDQPVIAGDGHRLALKELPTGTRMAAHPLDVVVACPWLMDAINSPTILEIASRYLGCKPTISSLGVRWSLPVQGKREQTQLFHRDPDDWRFLKLFVYLCDVDSNVGPHVYVAGSNNTAGTIKARTYSQEMLDRTYGADKSWTITGPCGTTFIADTHGIHMGLPPRTLPRLILQVQYSILPIFAFAYEPVVRPRGLSIDPYVNRLVVH